jgi:hypothetical protein
VEDYPQDEEVPSQNRGPLRGEGFFTPTLEGLRLRRADDSAWSIFVHLYCAVTPQMVRHAEGRSSKDWRWSHRMVRRLLARWLISDELLLERDGRVAAWLQVHPARSRRYDQVELLALPALGAEIAEFIRCGLALAGPRAAIQPLACRVREYDVEVLHALEDCGFRVVGEEALLVKHSTARVTERQLLVAAQRAQGLARLDLYRYQGRQGDMPSPPISASLSTSAATSHGAAISQRGPLWGSPASSFPRRAGGRGGYHARKGRGAWPDSPSSQ